MSSRKKESLLKLEFETKIVESNIKNFLYSGKV